MIDRGRPGRKYSSSVDKVHGPAERSSPDHRPLLILIGLAVAIPSLVLLTFTSYRVLYTADLAGQAAAERIAVLGAFYIAGVSLFSYAFKRHDVQKALGLTLVILVVTAIGVVLLAKAVALLAGALGFDLQSSDSSSKDSDSNSAGDSSGSSSSSYAPHGSFGTDYAGGGIDTHHTGSGAPSQRKDELGNALCPGCGQLAGNGPGGLCGRCRVSWL